MEQTNTKNLKKVSGKILSCFFIVYIVNGVLQSTSVSLKISNMIFIGGLFLLACVHILICMKENHIGFSLRKGAHSLLSYFKPYDLVVLLFLFVNLIWIFVIPPINGFYVSDAISEAGMMIIFVLYFPLAVLIRMKELNYKLLVKVFYISTIIVAGWHVVMWIFEAATPEKFKAFQSYLTFMKNLPIPLFNVGVSIEGWGIVRISISNSLLILSGFFMLFLKKEKLKWYDFLILAVFVFAMMATYLKSIWFALFAGMFVMAAYVIYNAIKKNQIKNHLTLLLATVGFIVLFNFVPFQNSTLLRLTSAFTVDLDEDFKSVDKQKTDKQKQLEGTKVSSFEKVEQMEKLTNQWLKQPVTGYGYGSSVKGYYRSATNLYSYEMTAFSLLMKTGAIGVLTWVLFMVVSVANIWKYVKQTSQILCGAVWVAIMGSLVVSVQTNPLLFSANALNLVLYAILLIAYLQTKSADKAKEKETKV